MSNTPIWLLMLGPAVAFFAAVIGIAQWRISRDKLMLDLFQHRIKIFNDARQAGRYVSKTGGSTPEITELIRDALEASRFLFGVEVVEHLRELHDKIIEASVERDNRNSTAIAAEARRLTSALSIKMQPYMRMDQKRRWFLGL